MVTRAGEHMRERGSDRVLSILLSVAVHAAIVGALLWGWWEYRSPPSAPHTLAIQATVVSHATQPRSPTPVHQPTPVPAPAPPAPSVAPPPPVPDQAQLAQQHAAEQAAAAKAAARAAQEAAAQQAAARAAAAEAAAERQAEAEAAARQAQLAAERKAKEEAEERARQEAAREAQQLAQQLKAEQAEQQRTADLQQQMQAEERLNALEQGPAETDYRNSIEARIERAWIRPPSAQPGVKCTVHLTQIPGGEITHVEVAGCNGDEAVRQSVETAAYRASPLPTPPDPALFDPSITVTFAPDQ